MKTTGKLLVMILSAFLSMPAYAIDVSKIDFGGQVRVRGYQLNNMWDFNDDTDYDDWSVFRIKSSLSAKVDLGDGVTGFVQFTNQTYGEGISDAGDNTSNKVFADNAYIQVNNFLDLPLTLKVGRQNLMYGSGFVLFDGQSQMASTSVYFDAVKFTYHITDTILLDAIYAKDQENNRADNPKDDITLSGIYLTVQECPIMKSKNELYVLRRQDDTMGKDIGMVGFRTSNKLPVGLDYSLEMAYQTGDAWKMGNDTMDQKAFGGKFEAGLTLDMPVKTRLFAGYVINSGDDDPTDDENNRWDVFYGGWPQYGDLLAWKALNLYNPSTNTDGNVLAKVDPGYHDLSTVVGEAPFSNLQMISMGASSSYKNFSGKLTLAKLYFDKVVAPADDKAFGNYFQLSAKYSYSKALSFSMYAALLQPDDAFKAVGADDDATEFFWETNIRF
ncbi:MAG: alginate export family protein [Candidatus Magnetomorum sp.]|nr:alginate export family protein [Candidatus Magnetomorum sp.]